LNFTFLTQNHLAKGCQKKLAAKKVLSSKSFVAAKKYASHC
jgi:hypothetical protein